MKCREYRSPNWWPTRLIYIGDEPLSLLRLVETSTTQPPSLYVTLSHRWGTGHIIQLVQANLDMMKMSIPLNNLPKTFAEAIIVARRLSVHYIWIDSLCIIQDSNSDWQREASLMSKVYQNSFCNICATGAFDSNDGLFFTRETACILPVKAEINLTFLLPTGLTTLYKKKAAYLVETNFWPEYYASAPIITRAWVVQERLLSPRVIHFGRNQIGWECMTMDACELYPAGIPPYVMRTGFKSLIEPHPADYWSSRPPGSEILQWPEWSDWVVEYTRRDLTFTSDKEAAIAGIAQFYARLKDDEIICGLRKRELPNELLWTPLERHDKRGRIAKRAESYRAPSWSWLSIDGIIKIRSKLTLLQGYERTFAKVDEIEIYRNGDGPLAPILATSYLRLRGCSRNFDWDIGCDDFGGRSSGGVETRLDIEYELELQGEVCCVLVNFTWLKADQFGGAGLLLLKLEECPTVSGFRRIGTFEIRDQEALLSFFQPLLSDPARNALLESIPRLHKQNDSSALSADEISLPPDKDGDYLIPPDLKGKELWEFLKDIKLEDLVTQTFKIV